MATKTIPSKEQFSQGSAEISHLDFRKKGLDHKGDLVKTLVNSSIIYRDLRIGVENMHKRVAVEDNKIYAFEEVD
jgi:hypothetical protein